MFPLGFCHTGAASMAANAVQLVSGLVLLGGALAVGFHVGSRAAPAPPPASVAARSAEPIPRHADTDAPTLAALHFEPNFVDLGEQPWATRLPVPLTIVNATGDAVTIASARSSCGCTVLDETALAGRVLQPDERLAFVASLDTRATTGEKHRAVTVTLDSGAAATAHIRVTVAGTWSVSPETIDFGEVDLSATDLQPLEQLLNVPSDTDRLIEASAGATRWLQCIPGPARPTGGSVLVRLLPDKLPQGVNSATLRVQTDCAVKPEVAIFVRAIGTRALTPTVGHVFLLADAWREVVFLDRTGARAALSEAAVTDDAVAAVLTGEGAVRLRRLSTTPAERITLTVRDREGNTGTVLVTHFVEEFQP